MKKRRFRVERSKRGGPWESAGEFYEKAIADITARGLAGSGLRTRIVPVTALRASPPGRSRKNPASVEAEVAQATKLFTDFRGAQPVEVRRVSIPSLPRVALTVGELFGIMYRTERDGRLENYLHRFRKSARPILAVSPDGRTLLILGGDYRVTDRGIEDAA